METKIPAIAITAVVVVIVLAGILIPVLDDATAENDTLRNDNGSELGRMMAIDDSTEYTFSWDVSNSKVATVNGEQLALFSGTVICGGDPDFLIRYYSGGTDYIQGRDGTTSFTADNSIEIVISSGSISITADSGSPITYTVSDGFAIASTGDYVMKSPNQSVFMLGDSEFNAYGVSSTDASTVWLKITGSIDDSATISIISGPNGTFSNIEIDAKKMDNYVDAYTLDKFTFTFTNASTSVDTPMTYNFFIVPAEVSAERTVHFSDNESAIFAAIPIMVIVALLLAVVAVIFRSRQF